jgi:hypothetical protein
VGLLRKHALVRGCPVAICVGLFLCRAKAYTDSFRECFGFLYRSYKQDMAASCWTGGMRIGDIISSCYL